MRESVDAEKVNAPRLIAGLPWKMVIGTMGFLTYVALTLHNWWFLALAIVIVAFLAGAGKRDPNFLSIYLRHVRQATRYSPAPVSTNPRRNLRPRGYGRYDPQ